MSKYPKVKDPSLVGTYPGIAKAGGGFVWDDVLEYRVWVHPVDEILDSENGDDYFYSFETYEEALEFSKNNQGSEEPLALIVQEEYISEPEPGIYEHIKEQRITEWPVKFLSRPRRTKYTIPDFMSPNAPLNRLDIIRGLNK
jgi:hypothetical protein